MVLNVRTYIYLYYWGSHTPCLVHGGNGYLVQQFLDLTANTRTDQWGGSVENRARFCLEVVKVMIEVWGADRVAVKLNPAGGYNDMGMSLKDTVETYSYVINALNELKVVYIALLRYAPALDPTIDGPSFFFSFFCLQFYFLLLTMLSFREASCYST